MDYKNKKCLVLACGPSIKDVGEEKIKLLSEEYFFVTIKQAYFRFKELAEFQFFNCNNFIKYEPLRAKFICCSFFDLSHGRSVLWGDQKIDQYYQLKSQRKFSDFEDLDEYFDINNMGSFKGPGIIYELVLPFLYNLGVTEILTAGWDYSDSEGYVEHFYSETKRMKFINPANKPYFGENAESIKNSAKVNKYFKSKGVSLKCIQSSKCFLDSSIERLVL